MWVLVLTTDSAEFFGPYFVTKHLDRAFGQGADQMMQLELRVPLFLPEVSWRLCPDSMKSGYVYSLPSSLRKEQRVSPIGAIVEMKVNLPLLLCHSSAILYFFPITSEWKTWWLASPYPCQLFTQCPLLPDLNSIYCR